MFYFNAVVVFADFIWSDNYVWLIAQCALSIINALVIPSFEDLGEKIEIVDFGAFTKPYTFVTQPKIIYRKYFFRSNPDMDTKRYFPFSLIHINQFESISVKILFQNPPKVDDFQFSNSFLLACLARKTGHFLYSLNITFLDLSHNMLELLSYSIR